MVNPFLIYRAHKNGIKHPILALRCSKKVGLDFNIACMMLLIESNGGENIFDRGDKVTKKKYLAYKKVAQSSGRRRGVGPMQLTSSFLQDLADEQGGCWNLEVNMTVGFKYLKNMIDRYGLVNALYHWYGSMVVARNALRSSEEWKTLLRAG